MRAGDVASILCNFTLHHHSYKSVRPTPLLYLCCWRLKVHRIGATETTKITPGSFVLFDVRVAPKATEAEVRWFHTHCGTYTYLPAIPIPNRANKAYGERRIYGYGLRFEPPVQPGNATSCSQDTVPCKESDKSAYQRLHSCPKE